MQAGIGLAGELGGRLQRAALHLVDVRPVVAHQSAESGLGEPGEHPLTDQLGDEIGLFGNAIVNRGPWRFHAPVLPVLDACVSEV